MRILPLWLSFFVLLQSGFAAACHNVGDVHVICHDDGIETVYVETDTQAQKPGGDAMVCCSALALAGHRLAIEWVSPIHQDANGVQMQRDDTLMIGWQKAF